MKQNNFLLPLMMTSGLTIEKRLKHLLYFQNITSFNLIQFIRHKKVFW
jgi:hypothetical protein